MKKIFPFVKQVGKVNILKQADAYTDVAELSKSMVIFPNPNCGGTGASIINVKNDPIFSGEVLLTYSSKYLLTNVSSGFNSTG